jgi:hypothetical protein
VAFTKDGHYRSTRKLHPERGRDDLERP